MADEKIIIYHGSENIIKKPEFGKGEINNDYGQGFYCTKNKGLAGEWAVLWTEQDGYINEYCFDYAGLKVLYLNQMRVENWIGVLVTNRRGNYEEEYQRRIQNFIDKFGLDISEYDVIEGWRADDAFFRYVQNFFALALSVEKIQEALKFGELGNQICLKSEKAFEAIKFTAHYPAPVSKFLKSAKDRDANARRQYRDMPDKMSGTLLVDIVGRENL